MSFNTANNKVSIFNKGQEKTRNKVRSKRKGRMSKEKMDELGRRKLMMLHPMAYSLMALKSQEERPNVWVSDSFAMINNNPSRLSEKWIEKINSWTEELIKGMSLDEPEVDEGSRASLGPFKIMKIIPAKRDSEYPMPAIMCVDDKGWKWYFKTSKAMSFSEGSSITFVATVSAHKDGITFLKRASKISVVDDLIIKDIDKINLFK